jgi:NhaP-type Na+/H+ and K+/H+ antiporter
MNDKKDTEKEASFQSRLLRFIFRWVGLLAVSALVLYGAFWAAAHPNSPIALVFVVVVIVILLSARVRGWLRLLGKPQSQGGNSHSQVKPSTLEVTGRNISDGEDPNIKLQSLLADIDKWAEKLNQNTWQDKIIAKTKKIHPSLPMKFYRNDREILGKINNELEKKWDLLQSTQSEKAYLDLIQVLDNLLELINS